MDGFRGPDKQCGWAPSNDWGTGLRRHGCSGHGPFWFLVLVVAKLLGRFLKNILTKNRLSRAQGHIHDHRPACVLFCWPWPTVVLHAIGIPGVFALKDRGRGAACVS